MLLKNIRDRDLVVYLLSDWLFGNAVKINQLKVILYFNVLDPCSMHVHIYISFTQSY